MISKTHKITKLWLIIALLPIVVLVTYPLATHQFKIFKLRQTYLKIQSLTDNEKEIYEKYYSPQLKTQLSYSELLERRKQFSREPTSSSGEIISIDVSDDQGVVRSVEKYCFKNACSDDDFESVQNKTRFVFSSGRWYYSDDQHQCDRTMPYEIPEEFNRAVSLIIQRFSESDRAEDREFGKLFKSIRNCVDVQYAENQSEIPNSDAIFYFSPSSPTDHLTILVSPKFKSQDDLVTASVLAHELYHALLHTDGSDIFIPCINNEANAYIVGYNYYFMLNDQEKLSLSTRLQSGVSEEVLNYFAQNQQILNSPGETIQDKFYNYVNNNPDYLEQCNGR